MTNRNLMQLPVSEPIESIYSLKDIRERLSSIFTDKYYLNRMDGKVSGVLELILCLANEIQQLKDEKIQKKDVTLPCENKHSI